MEPPESNVELTSSSDPHKFVLGSERLEQGGTSCLHNGSEQNRIDLNQDGDKDTDIQVDNASDAASVCSELSIGSWKSAPATQRSKTSAGSSIIRSISSRARPIKEHELPGSTFLSIDLKPGAMRNPESAKKDRSFVRSSCESVSARAKTGLASNRSNLSDGQTLAKVAPLRLHSASSYTSPVQHPAKPNSKVKMPFKHSTNKPAKTHVSVQPGQDIIERTALATHVVGKILRDQRPPKVHHVQGRLLKARLKPLEPVKMTTPTIQQCRGIVAETRAYTASSSRTYQRWKAIISGAQAGRDLNQDRMSVTESVHRTSEASSPEPTLDLSQDTDDELLAVGDDTKENQSGVPEGVPKFGQGHKDHCESGLNEEVDAEERESTKYNNTPSHKYNNISSTKHNNTPSQREVRAESMDTMGTTTHVQGGLERHQLDSNLAGNSRQHSTFITEDSPGPSNLRSKTALDDVRPMTAVDNLRPKAAVDDIRPKTAVDDIRPKSVRFADDNTRQKSVNPAGQTKTEDLRQKSSNGKSSCRPPSSNNDKFGDSDHEGDDGFPETRANSGPALNKMLSNKSSGRLDSSSRATSGTDGKQCPSISGSVVPNDGASSKDRNCESVLSECENQSTINKVVPHPVSALHPKSAPGPVSASRPVSASHPKSAPRPMSASVIYESKGSCSSRGESQAGFIDVKAKLDARFASYRKKHEKIKHVRVDSGQARNDKLSASECEGNSGLNDHDKPAKEVTSSLMERSPGADYSQHTRVVHRPPKSNSQRDRAYRTLRKSMKPAQDRPDSSTVHSDTEVGHRKPRLKSASRDLRPVSAECFTERSQIESKHGLTQRLRPRSASCEILRGQSSSRLPGNTNVIKEDETKRRKFRPRSPTKVQFMDPKEVNKKRKARIRKFSGKPRKSVNRHVVPEDDGVFDADKMWEELPSDHSDDGLDTDDPFLSKFDQLETEFEMAKAELQGEKMKCLLSLLELDTIKETEKPIPETSASREDDETKMHPIDVVVLPREFEEPRSHDENGSSEAAGNSDLLNIPSMAKQQRKALLLDTTISSNLYRKTNRYVPVKNKVNRPSSGYRVSAKLMMAGNDASQGKDLDKGGKGEMAATQAAVQEMDEDCDHNKEIKGTILYLPASKRINKSAREVFSGSEELTKPEDVKKQLEKDYPHLVDFQKKQYWLSLQREQRDEERNVWDRRRSDAESVQNTERYQDLVLAYRQHCMESSDDEVADEGITDWKTKSQTVHCPRYHRRHSKPIKTDTATKGSHVTWNDETNKKSRPWSGTTNDSGLESDSPSNLEEEESDQIDPLDKPASGEPALSLADLRPAARAEPCTSTNNGTRAVKEGQPNTHSEQNDLKLKITMNDDCEIDQESMPLEVVAFPKKMSKPRFAAKKEEDMSVLCKLPPLCFQLNARPPVGQLFYFAYDQNMSPDRICTYLACDQCPQRFWGLLFGFDLVFNKKGSDQKDVGGFPNLEYNPGSSVEGCVYQLTAVQLERLDTFMGYPQLYEHVVLPVWMSNCPSPDDLGVAQYCIPAVTYIAQNSVTWTEPVDANEYALSQCLKAADLVTPKYRDHLASFTTTNSTCPPMVDVA
ncbi:unnamed protein product [Lymnaea stagnalis]|uniref:Gamma-glutamylcyclotransferase AIG2-like domain-containing protein n=1 Tax=Lymnaea stagnalis TaxID=6523 RepID=A0AAV2HQ58_LYMST